MTDHNRTLDELSPRDQALLSLLDGTGPDPIHHDRVDDLDRETLEVCGLLAQSLEPVPVGTQARAALFDRLGLVEDPRGSRAVGAATATRAAEATVSQFPTSHGPLAGQAPVSSFASWALAATVLLALGLALWGGFMWSEVRQSRTVIASLTEELDRQTAESADFQQVRYENQQLRSHLAAAVQPHTRVCALNAVAADQPRAKGAVFLSPDNGSWVLAASNLAKCDLGRRYRLWFLDESGEYSGGEMLEHVNGEAEIELAAGDLPEGTQAILLTLEFPDKFGPEPAGERVLFGDRSVEVY